MASPGTLDKTEGSEMTTAWCSVVAAQYRSALDDMAITLRGLSR
jgi:hypothetical protein